MAFIQCNNNTAFSFTRVFRVAGFGCIILFFPSLKLRLLDVFDVGELSVRIQLDCPSFPYCSIGDLGLQKLQFLLGICQLICLLAEAFFYLPE
ncbi:hypothetical protein CH063_15523, partial [Colletotrichum higginsianum]